MYIFYGVFRCYGTYVLFADTMTYAHAAEDCANRGGTLAMATDDTTFNILRLMFNGYTSDVSKPVSAAWVDGIDTSGSGFQCATLDAACPPTMPWSSGEPSGGGDLHNCANVKASLALTGLSDNNCDTQFVRICDIP